MVKIIEEFDPMKITNVAVQFIESGTQQPGEPFGCTGSVTGETEMKVISKRCEGIISKKKATPQQVNLTVSAHVKVQVMRDVMGLRNEGLKPGIYAYSNKSKGKNFILTADVVDEFEDVTKLVAFPNCSSETGLIFNVSNNEEEVAELELTFTALPDAEDDAGEKRFYYEAIIDELDDGEDIKAKWHTAFTPELVQQVTPTP